MESDLQPQREPRNESPLPHSGQACDGSEQVGREVICSPFPGAFVVWQYGEDGPAKPLERRDAWLAAICLAGAGAAAVGAMVAEI